MESSFDPVPACPEESMAFSSARLECLVVQRSQSEFVLADNLTIDPAQASLPTSSLAS